MNPILRSALVALLVPLGGCAGKPARIPTPEVRPELSVRPVGEEIVACGARFRAGVPVVLWTDPRGFDATRTDSFFEDGPRGGDRPRPGSLRYTPGRVARGADGEAGERLVEPDSLDLEALRGVVDQVVLHYDACGTSKGCFRVLHDLRGLSAHLLVDLDGTVWQTLDLRDQAWHATKANPRSIGIEIASIGALPVARRVELDEWYAAEPGGARVRLGELGLDGDLRTRPFVALSARPEPVTGFLQGEQLVMYDLTPEQYDSLVHLLAALCRIFPAIEPVAPRDASGRVARAVLAPEEYERFRGILGHHHVQANKVDPGPALDWERLLGSVRAELLAGSDVR